ncbi:hypothetical protein [Cryobacterium sp. PH31-O1]|uniref:hypothetical protein n=1 Tax=Cryobacterium sp. PH31-O1 TaxID=3046306 RepID=UPI0024B99C8F|nr:hypothetical protein [Cryobacterium sp. PH31-O1]MDJ0337113.1 hypothetical protein [Cryobacterium sp. PH31-O1]
MNDLALELTRTAVAVAALGDSSAEFAGLSDAEVLAARGPIAALLRLTNTAAARLAGTIAERSRPQLGQSGLSARHGFGNPTLMVQHATGLSRIEAGHLCDTGYLGILFNQTGQPLNMGREQRLFNREQRRALAVRDGGCRWPGCDRPPAWTETHHIENWADLGLSKIDQAILLCAHHHLLLHNQHWKILLRGGHHWLQSPTDIDPNQTLIALPSKNPLMYEQVGPDPHQLTTPMAGTAHSRTSRDGGLDKLDQRRGDDPRSAQPHDDYQN